MCLTKVNGGPKSSHLVEERTRAAALPMSLRKKVDKEELSQSQQAGFIYLILCTVSGVAAGLQNTG